MIGGARHACLLLLLASWASASAGVGDQDLSAAVRQLDVGDWNARMRTVHELEYLRDAAIPALAVASIDGDWQVRMAAVHALAFLGPKAVPLLKSILKNEPCPVVRLITLHDLGSQAEDGAEEQAMDWIFSASNAQINHCRDQPAPGRAPWGPSVVRQFPGIPELALTPAPPASDVVPASVVRRSSGPAPTRSARFAELDAILDEPGGTPEHLDGAPGLSPRPASSSGAAAALPVPPRRNERAALPPPRTGTPESLPRPVVTGPAPERPIDAAAAFEAAGGKAPHDALPDLLAALKSRDVKTRSRAADELGHLGGAGSAAAPALMSALRDKSPRVRASASLALGNIGAVDEGVVPLLVAALKDKNADVRYAAALALSRIDTPAARAAFKRHIGEDARRAIERQP